MAKRTVQEQEEEFQHIGDISPSKRAKGHGYVQSLSPLKQSPKGSRYFTCEVTDGSSQRRAIGFDSKIHEKLAAFQEKKLPVSIGNCAVKERNFSPNLEVVIRNISVLQKPTLEFSLDPNSLQQDDETTMLEQLSRLANCNRITVKVKIVEEFAPVQIKQLTKQEYIIADATASTKIITWEKNSKQGKLIQVIRPRSWNFSK